MLHSSSRVTPNAVDKICGMDLFLTLLSQLMSPTFWYELCMLKNRPFIGGTLMWPKLEDTVVEYIFRNNCSCLTPKHWRNCWLHLDDTSCQNYRSSAIVYLIKVSQLTPQKAVSSTKISWFTLATWAQGCFNQLQNPLELL